MTLKGTPKYFLDSGKKEQQSTKHMTTKYLFQGKNGYEWLDAIKALRRALADSFDEGRKMVPMDTGDFGIMMQHANSQDARGIHEQVEAFARAAGFGFDFHDHARVVRFFAQRELWAQSA
jgi:hypothetical protein